MPGPLIQVEGIADVRRSLKAAGAKSSDLSKAHRRVAKLVEGESRAQAPSGTRQQAAAAKALLGQGTTKEAQLAIRNTKRIPFGKGAFLGGKRPQFEDWVGTSWDVMSGDGPYVIAEAMRDRRDDILDEFEAAVMDVFQAVGLDPGDFGLI